MNCNIPISPLSSSYLNTALCFQIETCPHICREQTTSNMCRAKTQLARIAAGCRRRSTHLCPLPGTTVHRRQSGMDSTSQHIRTRFYQRLFFFSSTMNEERVNRAKCFGKWKRCSSTRPPLHRLQGLNLHLLNMRKGAGACESGLFQSTLPHTDAACSE